MTDKEEPQTLNLPSCLESLVSSGLQLRHLSHTLGDYYIRSILVYGYAYEPTKATTTTPAGGGKQLVGKSPENRRPTELKLSTAELKSLVSLAENQPLLESLDSVLYILPLLNELNGFLEGAFETLKSTLKRIAYYMNKAAAAAAANSASFSDNTNREFQLTSDVKFHCLFVAMMDLFYALLSLERTIENHTNICENLDNLKTICKLICNSTDSQLAAANLVDTQLAGIPKVKLDGLIEFVDIIQLGLCRGNIFSQCLEHLGQLTYTLDLKKLAKSDKTLDEHLAEFILLFADTFIEDPFNSLKLSLTTNLIINQNLNKSLYLNSRSERLLGLFSLIAVYLQIFKKRDKRIQKSLLQLVQKYKCFDLVPLLNSNSYLQLSDFLTKHLPAKYIDTDKCCKQMVEATHESILNSSPSAEFDRFYLKLTGWLIKFKSICAAEDSSEIVNLLRDSLRQGIASGQQTSTFVRLVITGYLHLGRPISKTNLVNLLRLVSACCSIEASLEEERLVLDECLAKLQFEMETEWRKTLNSIQKRLMSTKFSDRKLDTNSMLMLTSQCLNAFDLDTEQDFLILSLCMPMLNPSLDCGESSILNELIHNMQVQKRPKTNFGYLYWSIPTFGSYYQNALCEPPCAINEISYFHRSLDDVRNLFALSGLPEKSLFENSQLIECSKKFLSKLEDELVDQFKSDFLDRVCQEFEIELRLQTHRDLNLNGASLFERHNYNFKQIFYKLSDPRRPFRILSKSISLKEYVESHLNKVSYNLTAIAPNDWSTYDKMINLAKFKYNLEFLKSQLPTQTLDYGLDLMDITRNLALFVSRYSYDLTNQLFLERCSARWSSSSASSIVNTYTSTQNFNHQNLNVIQVKHVSKSIQTHGFGVLNSSVNCVYQAMKRLVNLFAKQLSDDKLRAILVKEHQQLCFNSSNRHKPMTFNHANRLAKKFRILPGSSLNPNEPKLPIDLDSLRQLITQLGNLLGLVRMLKGGSLHLASKCVDYLPDLDKLTQLKLQTLVKSEFSQYENQQTLLEAGRNFDLCLEDFNDNFLSKTDYIRLIVDLFARILGQQQAETKSSSVDSERRDASGGSGSKMDQLRLFYVLVPPLTINFIDHLSSSKERVLSRSSSVRAGGLLTDDGFSMGVAFLLTVLEQRDPFVQLNWFQVVIGDLEASKEEASQRSAGLGNAEESLRQTSLLTLKRLDRLMMEYNNLKYSLNSALLFMRS